MQDDDAAGLPVHELVLPWQDHVLDQLLSPITLSRLIDSELKVPPSRTSFTAAELLQRLTAADLPRDRKAPGGQVHQPHAGHQQPPPQLAAALLSSGWPTWPMGSTCRDAPADCQTVAYAELEALEARLKKVLAGKAELDAYTRAHLTDLAARIRKVLDARIELNRRNP